MAAGTGDNSADADPAEVDRLRLQVAELREELATTSSAATPATPHHPGRWRSIFAVCLIVIGCVLAPLAVVSVWASSEVSDTNRYVDTVAPLADNPAVQAAVTDDITRQISNRVDINALTTQVLAAISRQGLAPRVAAELQGLNDPIAAGVQGFLHTAVAKVVASPAFETAWELANRRAHEQLVSLLSGKQSGALTSQNGAVQINLGPFIAQVKQRLISQGFGFANQIPVINTSLTLVQSHDLTKLQRGYRLLKALGLWLPFIAVGFLGLGIYVAKRHRRAVIGAGLGVTVSMLLLGAALAVVRPLYIDAVPVNVLPHDAAGAIFDTLVGFLRSALRATALVGLVFATGAFLTGQSATAVNTRSFFVGGIGRLRGSGESAGPRSRRVGAWTYTHRRVLRICVVVAGLAILALIPHSTVTAVVVITVIVVLAIGAIEFFARAPGASSVTGPPLDAATIDLIRARDPADDEMGLPGSGTPVAPMSSGQPGPPVSG
jgi:hypothetical protein